MSNFLIDEDTDLLAAEFVLGTLDSEERANAQSRLRMDHGFIAMVRIWERRFGELHLMVEPVEPDAKILQRIKAKIAEISPREPAPAGTPPTEVTQIPERPEATGSPLDRAVDVLADRDASMPHDIPAKGTTPEPHQEGLLSKVSATGETENPAMTAPAPNAVVPLDAELPAGAKVAVPAPLPLPPAPLELPDKVADQGQRPGRPTEITKDAVRSRGRWRLFGVCMILLVMGLVALLAAWRLVPDRLPGGLRPAELLMSLGIQALPEAAPAVKPAPPAPQFDE